MSLLQDINSGNYAQEGSISIFGAESVLDANEELYGSDGDPALREVIGFFQRTLSERHTAVGREVLVRRTTLAEPHPFKPSRQQSLSPAALKLLRELLEQRENKGEPVENKVHQASRQDEIDAALTEEVLGKLSNAVSRALRLEDMELLPVTPDALKRYFEEANRCYLYGFKIACAVLCRAILEEALKNVCDPDGKIETAKRLRQDKRSYFDTLVRFATEKGKLGDEACALNVKEAGNWAIHNFPKFKKRWESKIDEILVNTRKVLLDLYA
jgi:hypothetical protein